MMPKIVGSYKGSRHALRPGYFGLDAMHIRRIEAGILNAGADFNHNTTPYDVGLGQFVDGDKADFIGKSALEKASKQSRLIGVKCDAEPHIGSAVKIDGEIVGEVTAGAFSPYLKHGIGIVLMEQSQQPGTK
eukprot:UN25910